MDPGAIRYWLIVLSIAAGVAVTVGHSISRGEAARTAWGRTRIVLVTTRALRAGDRIGPAVRRARWPIALVPSGALDHAEGAERAAADLDIGTPLTSSMLRADAPPSVDGRTIAIARSESSLPVRRGDRVEVWATVDASLADDGHRGTERVAMGARVVWVGPRSVVVSVRPDEVRAVARAASVATVTLVGTG